MPDARENKTTYNGHWIFWGSGMESMALKNLDPNELSRSEAILLYDLCLPTTIDV
jgi:hypothetical protein